MNDILDLKELDGRFLEETKDIFHTVYYNCFAIFVIAILQDQEELEAEWKNLQAAVSGYIHNNKNIIEFIEDDDIIYDTYLVLLIKEKIDISLKTEIENDRYFCKKVILEYNPNLSLTDNINQLVLFQKLEDDNKPEGSYIDEKEFRERLINSSRLKDDTAKLLENNGITQLEEIDFDTIISDWISEVEKDV